MTGLSIPAASSRRLAPVQAETRVVEMTRPAFR
jgi:hypothetical protein